MAKRPVKDPFPEWPEWSNSKFFGFLRSGIRAKSSRWPAKYEALARARRPYTGPNPRQKFEYQCAGCSGWFQQKNISVDHIIPAGTLRSFEDLPQFCERLFVGTDKLQVLCSDCHQGKTTQERVEAKKNKEKATHDNEHSNTKPKAKRPTRSNRNGSRKGR